MLELLHASAGGTSRSVWNAAKSCSLVASERPSTSSTRTDARALWSDEQLLSGKAVGTAVAAQAGRRLELLPEGRAFLRVVAHPWAHVIVDGQEVEITPFARPIPLSAGSHYVRLEHPNAPVERRTIELTPGETLLLDVTLHVSQPKADAGTAAALEKSRAAGAAVRADGGPSTQSEQSDKDTP